MEIRLNSAQLCWGLAKTSILRDAISQTKLTYGGRESETDDQKGDLKNDATLTRKTMN